MKRKLGEGQVEDGVGWYTRRGKKLWRFAIYVRNPSNGKLLKRKGSGFESRADAEKAANLLRFRAEVAGAGLTPISARPTLAELVEQRIPTITPKNEQTRARRVLQCWLGLLPAGFQVQSVESEHIRIYLDKRLADGQAPSSVDRELNIIAATLHQAGEFFSSLKQWKAPRVPRPKIRQSRRDRVITEDEYRRLLAALNRPADEKDGKRAHDQQTAREARLRVGHIFQFAMLSAARHSEIVGLEWRSVDWENGRVVILQRKTGRYKQIPITAPMRRILEHYRENPISPKYVLSQSGKIYPKFYKILRRACEMAGVEYGRDNPEGIVLHTARHTVTTRLIQQGSDLDTAGLITGHGAKTLIAHYSHHSPASLARAAQALEAIGKAGEENQD